MILVDYIFIAMLVGGLLIGSMVGFGNGLKFFTGGIFGKIISIVVCYFLFGVVLSWGFVQELLTKFVTFLSEKNTGITNFLLTIRIDLIVFGAVLFTLVQIARRIVVAVVAGIFCANNIIMVVINKVLGVALFVGMLMLAGLIILQVIYLINGVDGTFYQSIQGSVMGVDKLFVDNPLNYIFSSIEITY